MRTGWKARPHGDGGDTTSDGPACRADEADGVSGSRSGGVPADGGPPEARPVAPGAVGESMMRSAAERAPVGMTVTGLDGHWLWANEAFCRMLGYELAELMRLSVAEVSWHDGADADAAFIAAARAGQRDVFEREKRYVHRDGSLVWGWLRAEIVRDANNAPLYFVAYVHDASDRRRVQELLRTNQRTLRAVIDNTSAMICVKSRDHRFQLVNRRFAEHFGVSEDWLTGRPDSDLLPPSMLADVHARERAVLDGGQAAYEEQTTMVDGREQVALITRFPLLDERGIIDALCVTTTDVTALRQEQRAERERIQSRELIASALAEDRFVLYGQPIVHLASSRPSKAELLIRMRPAGDSHGLRSPGLFLPAAERLGLISTIDAWVIDQAIGHAAAGHQVAVNVSAKTACDPGQVERIASAIVDGGAPTENLIFEITETAVAGDLDAARSFAVRMRDLGCAMALDDFGVGHGSFTYLRHLPLDYLKIDMQFVRDLLNDEEDREVVCAIVGVAQHFGAETIAEGVEDQRTLETLQAIGVDYAQGYLMGRPMPLDECWDRLGSRSRGDPHVESE